MQSLKTQLKTNLEAVKVLAKKAQDEKRDFTDEEIKQIGDLRTKADDLSAKIKAADEAQASIKSMLANATPIEETPDYRLPQPNTPGAFMEHHSGGVVSPGLHEESKAFRSAVTKAMSDAAPMIGGVGRKALIPTGSVSIDYGRIPLALPGQTDFLANHVQQDQVGTPSGMYLREENRKTAAATVPMGAEKPVLEISLEPVTWRCATVAVLSQPMPLQNLSDYGQLQSYIVDRLAYDSMRALDTMILNGGTDEEGNTFKGVLGDTSVTTIAFDTDIIATLRDAMEDLQLANVTPAIIALHPSDWKALETAADSTGRPILNFQPSTPTSRTLYGVPVVVNPTVPVGTALMGDLNQAVALLTRQQSGIISWHQVDPTSGVQNMDMNTLADSLFTKNLGQIRYEGRYALTIPQPTALRKVSVVRTA
ncbi:MAG: phage major capsid protein [Bifidobacterium tibiigranuli]|jgi:HK97 family phage major capsid protein|uniref:phage major capsid protein n=1 Tax=Bifidobacterium tibiigranuli TaxID=2172043 RepID=UPI00235557C6|nr:phage major capsid protein [Bifidobacterium tibiigranuli]MCH3973803.1 phage major capsid protein [Bifidobacterium tibiigranuli]MCH4189416.1 phage major capsid protein [Bifidobacterium tibiigranuli]MCH4203798.1 phage major capsid protein [Bifidobacterium tibiigranuli]MCH4274360.1 phage major capsid protein [Bifidobacterium tibiigranuli]